MDQEIANVLIFDIDLIFLETRVEMEISRATTLAALSQRYKMTSCQQA